MGKAFETAQKIGGTAAKAVEDKLEFLIDVLDDLRDLVKDQEKREEV